ncbi:MAG: hypothetical protein HZA35_03975 [Parcubacteria group bacterium]|nr:hypothetical protein [Parcubacteria group bacterium]
MEIRPNKPITPAQNENSTPKSPKNNASEEKRVETTTTEESHLREVFGERFFGSDDWKHSFGISLSREQLANIPRFPWSNAHLNQPCPFTPGARVRDTHMAFLGIDHHTVLFFKFSVTINLLSGLRGFHYQPRISISSSFQHQNPNFTSQENLQYRWYLAPLQPPHYSYTIPNDAIAQLPRRYSLSSTLVETTKLFLYYAKNGIYPRTNTLSFTSDEFSHNSRVLVGVQDNAIRLSTTHYRPNNFSITTACTLNPPRKEVNTWA